jgi:hypothetical protein
MIKKAVADKTLYEGIDLYGYTPKQIMDSKKLYNYIVESAEIAKEQNVPLSDVLDEGIFGSLVGMAAGATIGPSIMKAICKVLGIDEKGALGSLMTSKVILSAMGSQLGYRM